MREFGSGFADPIIVANLSQFRLVENKDVEVTTLFSA